MIFLLLPLFIQAAERPNIVLIYADDIGYGDFGCYGATKVKTPNVDRLAAGGLRFTDAHSPASTCTPSRYAMLTGQYAFRKGGTGIASGVAGLILDPKKNSLPSMLQKAGYATGLVGKWHLGLGTRPTDYNGEIKPGPLECGFNSAWFIPATGDRVPCVYVDGHRVANLDPADPIALDYQVQRGQPGSVLMGIPRIGGQTGGKTALWKDEDMAAVLATKSAEFIARNKARPFFLLLATHGIHVPRVPHPRFRGQSECGVRGDALVEFDWTVGEIIAALEKNQLTSNTLVIVTSDNGGALSEGVPRPAGMKTIEEENLGHRYNGGLRGGKGGITEGATRLPFIAHWPGRIRPGVSDALLCQIDLFASFAALTGQTLGTNDAPDSENLLPALLGQSKQGRAELIEQNNDGSALALRRGAWKFTPAGTKPPYQEDSGQSSKKPMDAELYDLATDLGETRNVAAQHPELVRELTARLAAIKSATRTRP